MLLCTAESIRLSKMVAAQCIAVVVSPLITLMKDQVWQMVQRGVSVVYVGMMQWSEICDGK